MSDCEKPINACQGKEPVWELAKKIASMSQSELTSIFGTDIHRQIYHNNTYVEARRKIEARQKEIEARHNIKVGDVCKYKRANYLFVVTRVRHNDSGNGVFSGVCGDGMVINDSTLEEVEATGEHITDICEILRRLGGTK